MKLKRLELRNYKGIEALDIELNENLTIFIGVNGSGKSTTLDAIATLLSWVTARTKNSRGSGQQISVHEIKNGHKQSKIAVETTDDIYWKLVKTKSGHVIDDKSDLTGLKGYIDSIQQAITADEKICSIPLFAYYPINRAVLDIPLRIRNASNFSLLEAWDDSLTSASNFRSFFSWFRQREDLENENHRYIDSDNKPKDWQYPDKQLQCVRKALTKFLPDFTDFRVRRHPLRMTVKKHGEELAIEQLSDGEKCMIALVGDIARRLAIANPDKSSPIEGTGIVLIDEIDMHLHPQWQRQVMSSLPEVFNNVQFIVTTHSPQALGEIKAEHIWLLQQDSANKISATQPKQSYGLTTNEILNELMRDRSTYEQITRNKDVEDKLDAIFHFIENNQTDEANKLIDELEQTLGGDIPELIKAKFSIELSGWDD